MHGMAYLGHNRPSPHGAPSPNGNTRQNNSTTTDPHIVLDMNFFPGLGTFETPSHSGIKGMRGTIETNIGAEENPLANLDQTGVKDDGVEIQE